MQSFLSDMCDCLLIAVRRVPKPAHRLHTWGTAWGVPRQMFLLSHSGFPTRFLRPESHTRVNHVGPTRTILICLSLPALCLPPHPQCALFYGLWVVKFKTYRRQPESSLKVLDLGTTNNFVFVKVSFDPSKVMILHASPHQSQSWGC